MNFTEGRTFALVETFRGATYNVENYLDDTVVPVLRQIRCIQSQDA